MQEAHWSLLQEDRGGGGGGFQRREREDNTQAGNEKANTMPGRAN